jgi:exonuclease SbcC
MIPQKLTLQGFLSYRDLIVVDLSKINVACVSGANGAGKSTLFDAITWSLFGKARRSDDALINNGMDSCQVVFEFRYENEHYRVERSKHRGKSTILEFQVKGSDGIWKPLTEAGIRATEDHIKEVLRLDYETFVNASFFLQGKADMFAVQPPGKRKEILSNILGLEVWEIYRDETARRRRAIQNEVNVQQSLLVEVIDELNEEDDRSATLKNFKELLKKTTCLRESKDEYLGQVRGQVLQLEADEEKISLFEEQAASFETRLRETRDLLTNRMVSLTDVEKTLQNSNEIKKNYQSWQNVRKVLSSLDTAGMEYNQLNLKRGEINGKIQAAAARLTQERLSLEQKQKEITAVQNAGQDIQRSLSEKTDRIEQVQSKLKDFERLEAELDDSKQKKADRMGENNQLKVKMKEIKERIGHLENTHGADCPLCGQNLNRAHKQKMIKKLNIEGKDLGDLHRKNETGIKQCTSDILRLKKEINSLKKLRPKLTSLQSEVGILEQQIMERAKRVKEWEEKDQPRLKDVADLLDKAKMEKESKKELAILEKRITELKYSPEQHENIRIEEFGLRGIEDQFRELEQARTAQEGLRREIDEYEKRIGQLQNDFNKNIISKESLQKQVKYQRRTLPDLAGLEKELGDIRKEENKIRLRVGGAKQAIDVLKVLRKRKVQIGNEINENNLQIARLKMLEVAFGKNGIPALLIEQSLPQIEAQANEVLDRLSNGAMSVSFETQREYRDKKREDKKQTLDIIIRDGAGSREYELFSGGEAFRINFAIRLALSRVLAQRSGARLQTLVIDEGFGSQDAEGRQRLVEAINMVNPDFEKILVITHLEELKDAFPSRIEVTKTASGSSVEVIP